MIVRSAFLVAIQRGVSFAIRLNWIAAPHPQGHIKAAAQGMSRSPIKYKVDGRRDVGTSSTWTAWYLCDNPAHF